MAARVQEHVCERISHFTGRSQDTRVEPFGEDRASVAERPVERACDAGAHRHHAAPERIRVRHLDEKMCVRGLEAVVHEPKVIAVADGGKAAF